MKRSSNSCVCVCVRGGDREGGDRHRVREIVSGEARVRKERKFFSVEQMLEGVSVTHITGTTFAVAPSET